MPQGSRLSSPSAGRERSSVVPGLGRHRSPLGLLGVFLAIVTVSIMVSSGSLVAVSASAASPLASTISRTASGNDAAGATVLAAAEASLAQGGGPANGQAANCASAGAGLSAACEVAPLASQGGFLSSTSTTGMHWQSTVNPAARELESMAYDWKTGYVVMFGGTTGNGTYYGDTWEFLHGRWIQLIPIHSPSPRAGASLAFDKKDGYLLLFGGWGTTGALGDTWSFDGTTWTQLAPAMSPSPRSDAATTWDAKDNAVLLFGGWNGVSTLADTWEFAVGAWKVVTPTTVPPGRQDAAIAWDNLDHYVVMFGGENGMSIALADTWEFVGGQWTLLTGSVSPSARSQASMLFDTKDNYVMLFGGVNLGVPVQYGDTWEFAYGVWTQLVTATAPSLRSAAGGAYDNADSYAVIFSGNQGGPPAAVPDTWEYAHGNWSQSKATPEYSWPEPSGTYAASMAMDLSDTISIKGADPYDLYFGGLTPYGASAQTWAFTLQQWVELFPNPSPSARSFAAMTYDARDSVVVLFGGLSATGAPLGDTWTFHGGTWTQQFPSGSPPARYGAYMAFDTVDNYVLLFGGVGSGGTDLSDTWTYAAGTWTQVTPTGGTSPSARAFGSMTYDAHDSYTVLFGGLSGATTLSDTWKYLSGSWKLLTEATHPSARWGAGMVYAASNNIVLLFGGCQQGIDPKLISCDSLTNDSWRFSKGGWGPLSRNPSPTARAEAACAFDSYKINGVVIDGGLVNLPGQLLGSDRWLYTGVYSIWAPPFYPPAQAGGAAVYDLRDQHTVVFGGIGPTSTGTIGYLNETWMQDTNEWLPADPLRSPSARAFGAMAYDVTDSYVVFFGGVGPSGYLGDTWKWVGSPSSGDWTQLHPTTSPSARANASMVWDQVDKYVVLFGGQNSNSVFGDTWTFIGGQWTQLQPTTSPSPRAAAGLANDSEDHYLVLFGGFDPFTDTAYSDTWTFLHGTWTQLTTTSAPTPRFGAAFLDNPVGTGYYPGHAANGVVILFGGETASGTFLGDTWTYLGGVWTQIFVGVTATPPARAFAGTGNDINDGNINLFGGETTGGYFSDSWFLTGAVPSKS